MLDTYYAPAVRKDAAELERQVVALSENPVINNVLNSLGTVLVVLNEQRQIVAFNNFFISQMGIKNPEKAMGLRLGETLGCIHSSEMAAGCGTSRSCGTCGAVIAMMVSLIENKSAERVCALKFKVGDATREMSLLVSVSPILFEKERFLVVTVRDVTREQIRANLERVFYHDINNILTSLLLPSEILGSEEPKRWEVHQIQEATERLRKEIALQREISLSGGRGLVPELRVVTLGEIKQDLELLIRGHHSVKNKTVDYANDCWDAQIKTDKMLVSRILFNMVINALEASVAGSAVTVRTSLEDGHVRWDVWNQGCIPDAIQERIFQRYFSTKEGEGRGVGTYSMKLLGETYLNGTIRFTSNEVDGTVFTFVLPIE